MTTQNIWKILKRFHVPPSGKVWVDGDFLFFLLPSSSILAYRESFLARYFGKNETSILFSSILAPLSLAYMEEEKDFLYVLKDTIRGDDFTGIGVMYEDGYTDFATPLPVFQLIERLNSKQAFPFLEIDGAKGDVEDVKILLNSIEMNGFNSKRQVIKFVPSGPGRVKLYASPRRQSSYIIPVSLGIKDKSQSLIPHLTMWWAVSVLYPEFEIKGKLYRRQYSETRRRYFAIPVLYHKRKVQAFALWGFPKTKFVNVDEREIMSESLAVSRQNG